MKILFIPCKAKFDVTSLLKHFKTEEKLGLLATSQYIDQLEEIKKVLPKSTIGGQVLGCNVENAEKISKKVDSFLFIGSDLFHPIQIGLKTKKKVYILNPITQKLSILPKDEVERKEKQLKGRYLTYLNSKNKACLVSTKQGQCQLKKALKLKHQIFLFNTLRESELENFPQIDCWINTACNRIEGKNIINLEDIPNSNER
jgi:2-(3-amino-3-carboxypropyl)histidine synthase